MVSVWRVLFAADAENDLALIEAFLTKAYQDFEQPSAEASQHAATRVDATIANAERLAVASVRGTGHDDLLSGLRHLALDQAIDWFLVCAEEAEIRGLAVFFGGQDHQRHMLVQLLAAGR